MQGLCLFCCFVSLVPSIVHVTELTFIIFSKCCVRHKSFSVPFFSFEINSKSRRTMSKVIRIFKKDLRERAHLRERGGRGGRGRENLQQIPCWAQSLTRGSIPHPRDHDRSWNQDQSPNQLSHPSAPVVHLFLYRSAGNEFSLIYYFVSKYIHFTLIFFSFFEV